LQQRVNQALDSVKGFSGRDDGTADLLQAVGQGVDPYRHLAFMGQQGVNLGVREFAVQG
jgi:hypothetical protein